MWFKKAMVYLGLDDEEYQDHTPEEGDDHETTDPPPARQPVPASTPSNPPGEPSGIGTVRPMNQRHPERKPAPEARDGAEPEPEPTPSEPVRSPGPNPSRPRPQVVRPIAVASNARPQVVTPTSFNEAQEVADTFKSGQPAVMNLQGVDRELSRRLIDFASGLCYGLGGQMERVASQVYLLTPANVEVSADERRRLHERGYDA